MSGGSGPIGPPMGPLEEFAAGLARGTLQWTADTIRSYLKLINDGQLAFIGRSDLIAEAKARRKSPEYQFYAGYLQDKRLRLLALMGLALREYESEPLRKDDLQVLRNRILSEYHERGLHVAQIVQSRILAELIPSAVGMPDDKTTAAQRIEAFLQESERLCLFIKDKEPIDSQAAKIHSRLSGRGPPLFVMFARGRAAETCAEIARLVRQRAVPYEVVRKEIEGSLILIFIRNDLAK